MNSVFPLFSEDCYGEDHMIASVLPVQSCKILSQNIKKITLLVLVSVQSESITQTFPGFLFNGLIKNNKRPPTQPFESVFNNRTLRKKKKKRYTLICKTPDRCNVA